MNYNNLRGIEQFKNKLTLSLQKHNLSKIDIDKCVSKAVELFGNKLGVMPVQGMISATTAVSAIEKHLKDNSSFDIFDAISAFNIDVVESSSSNAPLRLSLNDVREEGTSASATLDGVALEIHDSVEELDSLVEVMAYNFDGTPAKNFNVSSIDMIDYMEEEDITDEGRRSRGFLPADFDSTDVLSSVESKNPERTRKLGSYGHDSEGNIYIQSPSGSKDVIPLGAGTYMCMDSDEIFEVDLLLDDINPEVN